MFTLFHLKKLRYEKGQLVPIFIVILAVLLIMALATVNIGKLTMTKTYTSNAADAGALAGGSIMAGTFNQQAALNGNVLKINHTMFMAEMFTLAGIASGAAYGGAGICSGATCPTPPAGPYPCCQTVGEVCSALVKGAQTSIKSAMVSLIAFQVAQVFSYLSMKKSAQSGRESAIRTAYQYAFINSGISTKLIPGKYADASAKRGDYYNYSDSFSTFLQDKDLVTGGVYTWTDGQNRNHTVTVNVDTHDVDTYLLQYCALPYLAVEAYLAMKALPAAIIELKSCWCCPAFAPNAMTQAMIISIAMFAAAAGTLPYGPVMEHNLFGDIAFLIAWIDDIEHDRLFHVITWQTHGNPYSYDTMWTASYPKIGSKSTTNFAGGGSIRDAEANFDADIIEVK